MKNLKQYYKELGKMVYAVAIADGVISPAEKETLHNRVLKILAGGETSEDSSGMNKAFYVDFEFDENEEKHADPEQGFRSYVKFIHANFEPGDETLLRNSLDVIEKVALAYSREKEKELVKELKSEITEIYK